VSARNTADHSLARRRGRAPCTISQAVGKAPNSRLPLVVEAARRVLQKRAIAAATLQSLCKHGRELRLDQSAVHCGLGLGLGVLGAEPQRRGGTEDASALGRGRCVA
jgi:hypothetical protein